MYVRFGSVVIVSVTGLLFVASSGAGLEQFAVASAYSTTPAMTAERVSDSLLTTNLRALGRRNVVTGNGQANAIIRP
jgi:hypothetical protein